MITLVIMGISMVAGMKLFETQFKSQKFTEQRRSVFNHVQKTINVLKLKKIAQILF